jgi:hypothetical protein
MRRSYGSSPLHLAAHAVAFAAAGWAIVQLADLRRADNVLVWFVAAVVLHDLLLLPVYSALDRAAARAAGAPAVNYIRIPAAFSALLFAVWFPTILGLNDRGFRRVAGFTRESALEHWLVLTAALFGLSAALWLLRGRRAAATPRPAP